MAGGASWIYRVSRRIVKGALWLLRGSPRVEGVEHLPARGGVILAANHISLLDPIVLSMMAYPRRYVQFMAKEELFRVSVFGWFMGHYGAMPLDRKRGDVGAIRRALGVLEEGGCVAVFPEGTRSKTGGLGRPKPGVGLLACEARTPVVPVRMRNTERWSPEPMGIRYGRPIHFSGEPNREAYQRFAEQVMGEIARL